jgi:hypothetical protein
MTTIPETVSIAGLAVIVFIILPAIAWILALLDRLEDHLDGRAPADMFKRFADVRSLYG